MMPCSAELTQLIVAKVRILGVDLPQETGTFPMELELLITSSTEPEVI